MQPLTELIKGLEILEPFLNRYGFNLDNFENGKGSGGQFTLATYLYEQKMFVIGYRFSVGELYYQFESFKVGHPFYLDHLGLGEKKQFPDFQSNDKLLAFHHILHDLEYLVHDFFTGTCEKLIEAAKMEEIFTKEQNEKARKNYKNEFEYLKIYKARIKFKEQNYNESLNIYKTVENEDLLSDFDKKIIIYCTKHINDVFLKI